MCHHVRHEEQRTCALHSPQLYDGAMGKAPLGAYPYQEGCRGQEAETATDEPGQHCVQVQLQQRPARQASAQSAKRQYPLTPW
jgi:hypothetical protein